MGTEVAWVPLVMSLAATAGTAYNTHQTAKKQDQTLAASINERGQRQREMDAEVNKLVTKQGESTPDKARRDSLSQYQQQLAKNQGAATNALAPMAGAGSTYAKDAADASLGVSEFGKVFADLMSRIDAPVRQRMDEANLRTDHAAGMGELSRRSKGQDFLKQLQLQGIRRNPWIDAGAGVLSGAAGSYSGGAGGERVISDGGWW